MADKKKRRFGNPARQAEVDAREREQAVAAQAAAAQRRTDADCTTGCCD